jgi:hypothetical protein
VLSEQEGGFRGLAPNLFACSRIALSRGGPFSDGLPCGVRSWVEMILEARHSTEVQDLSCTLGWVQGEAAEPREFGSDPEKMAFGNQGIRSYSSGRVSLGNTSVRYPPKISRGYAPGLCSMSSMLPIFQRLAFGAGLLALALLSACSGGGGGGGPAAVDLGTLSGIIHGSTPTGSTALEGVTVSIESSQGTLTGLTDATGPSSFRVSASCRRVRYM